MNKLLKSIILLSLIFLISFAGDCGGTPPDPPPECDWSEKTDIIFNEISLYYPANAPMEFRTIFPDNPIKDLSKIIFYGGVMQIYISPSTCDGSKVITYDNINTNIGISSILDIPSPKNDIITTAHIRLRSKEFYDDWMNLVYIYWDEFVDPSDYNSTDYLESLATIVPVSELDFKKFNIPIYLNGKIIKPPKNK